jgi:phage/plasmid-like protein (TIGR03299 family)
MPHDLATIDGQAAMMFVGEVPWHGLGQRLNHPATAAEAIKAAQLDWDVTKVPLFVKKGRRYGEVQAKFAVVRDYQPQLCSTKVFGIVGKQYKPLQNREAFAWFDGIVGEGSAIYHAAGALGDGERVWVLAKLPGEIRVKGDDIAEKFLLLSNSYDGESSVQLKFTPIRVVCQNTLTMALQSGYTVKVSHHPSLAKRMEVAKANQTRPTRKHETGLSKRAGNP